MDEMSELVNLETFRMAVQIATALLVVGGVIAGLAMRRKDRGLLKGLAVACLGPLLYVMWIYYCWMVRYDPANDYVGLHRVSVFVINVLVFIAIGVLVGLVFGRAFRARGDSA